MNKADIAEFFDRAAPAWDDMTVCDDEIIRRILDGAGVTSGKDILDVACGTGVMIPYYLKRNVRSVTAVDLSPRMTEIARRKFPQPNVTVLCGDVEQIRFETRFDHIMIYNAFPHFPDPRGVIRILSGLLKEGGTLTVAHGASRAEIDAHHDGHARDVSMGLMHEDELEALFSDCLDVTVKISDDRMYQVTGRKHPLSSYPDLP